MYKPTPLNAKCTRAAVDLLCDCLEIQRPVNNLTRRLVNAIVKNYSQGLPTLPNTQKIVAFLLVPPRCRLDAIFALFFGTGFRPSDLDYISALAWDIPRGLLWSRSSKGFPTGRNALVPDILLPHLSFLKSNYPSGYWWHYTQASSCELLQHFRCILAEDPARPPQVSFIQSC